MQSKVEERGSQASSHKKVQKTKRADKRPKQESVASTYQEPHTFQGLSFDHTIRTSKDHLAVSVIHTQNNNLSQHRYKGPMTSFNQPQASSLQNPLMESGP